MYARHRRHRRPLRPRPPAHAAHPCRQARRRGMESRKLGRGAGFHCGPRQEAGGRARPRDGGHVQARHQRLLHRTRLQGVRHAEHRCAFVRAVPRAARRRLQPDIRRQPGHAREHRHRARQVPGTDRHAPGREPAQLAGTRVLGDRAQWRHHHRRRSALFHRGQQGEILAAGEAGHRHRPAARVDERDRRRRPVRQGVRREVRHGLRGVRQGDRREHAGMGRRQGRRFRRADPQYGKGNGEDAPRHADPPGAAHRLVRRRRPAQPCDRAAERVDGQLGAQGRVLHDELHRPARLPRRAEVSEAGQAEGRQPGQEMAVRRPDGKYRAARSHHHRQALPDQGLDGGRHQPAAGPAGPGAHAQGHRRARPAGRRGHRAERDRELRRRRSARSRPTSSATTR